MINIKDFFESPVGIALISIIWGLGLSSLFKKTCSEPDCQVIEYRAPDADNLRDNIYHIEVDGATPDCYKYQAYAVHCSEKK